MIKSAHHKAQAPQGDPRSGQMSAGMTGSRLLFAGTPGLVAAQVTGGRTWRAPELVRSGCRVGY